MKNESLIRLIRRIWQHLVRSNARIAWLLVVLSFAAYVSIPVNAVGQFALILAGVAAGAIFLPELSSAVWKMRPDDIRSTMPNSAIAGLQQSLIEASVDVQNWPGVVWKQGLAPLLEAGQDPSAICWNVDYNITVELNEPVIANGTTHAMNRVSTRWKAKRYLPVDTTRLWVSVARTQSALLQEFEQAHCLYRELVSLPFFGDDRETWYELVKAECNVNVSVDGAPLITPQTAPELHGDVLRWYMEIPGSVRDQLVPINVSFDLVSDPAERTFPVVFADYYCAHSTHISFKLCRNGGAFALQAVEFLARGLGTPSGQVMTTQAGDNVEVSYESPHDNLLWPGSGILLYWEPENTADV